MFGSMGITELVLILFIVLIIFGAGKLPQLGEGLGKAIKGFKKSVHEADAIELEASKQEAQAPSEAVPSGPPPGPSPGVPAQPPPGPITSGTPRT
jgi:sec-independent protein translocase protein TatA